MNKNFFSDAISLDPAVSLAAWKKLGGSTWPHEIAGLPHIFHTALRNRLKKEQNQWQKMTAKNRS